MRREMKSVVREAALTLAVLAVSIILCMALAGCVYKGGKVVDGTNLAIGMKIPVENAPLKFEALNWLSGFRLGIDQNARLELEYTVAETNSYFGVVRTSQCKSVTATIEPCEAEEDHESEQH